MALNIGLFQLTEEFDVDPILGPLSLECANDFDFGVIDKPVWFPFIYEDSIVFNLKELEDPGALLLHILRLLSFRESSGRDGRMGVAFAQAVVGQYQGNGTDLFQILSFWIRLSIYFFALCE